ncbi:Poly(A) polymerase [Clarias magur]|uniref:Poly(A) polymerase n=1 Tax=Clarias magur TaxID=1594786 RepID=A0A8J4UGB2_CLAMG|nr:Poly(A) polymerase [Clarias magur]
MTVTVNNGKAERRKSDGFICAMDQRETIHLFGGPGGLVLFLPPSLICSTFPFSCLSLLHNRISKSCLFVVIR